MAEGSDVTVATLADESALAVGTVLDGRFRVERVLGAGAAAITYLAHDLTADRPVAVKALRARALADWKQLELFEREARVLGGLRHHGVPEVIATFQREDGPGGGLELYLAMEWVAGTSLLERIRTGPRLAQVELAEVAAGVLEVLAYLHGRTPPVFHRDIKPSNLILRPDGQPVLIDFGGVCDGWRAAAESGDTIVGTIGYMPPEQYMGQVGPWSDLYALGATLLHAILGRSPAELDFSSGRIAVPPDAAVPPRLRRLVDALLAPAPRDRPQSAQAARRLLLEDPPVALAELPDALIPAGPTPAPPRPLVDVGRPPRDAEGPLQPIYARMRGKYSPPFGCLFHALLLAALVAAAATESGALAILVVVMWVVVGAGLKLYATSVDDKLPADGTPGGHLFVHGEYAVGEIVTREERKTNHGSDVRLGYRFEANGRVVAGTVDVSVLEGVRSPRGTKLGILYSAEDPATHAVITEDLGG